MVTELLDRVRDIIGCLYQLSECVSILDMILSFAHSCTLSNYGTSIHTVFRFKFFHLLLFMYCIVRVCYCIRTVRPEFTNTLALKRSLHPILNKINFQTPVPNNAVSTLFTAFLHPFHRLLTPFSQHYYILFTALLHPFHNLLTPFSQPYYTLFTALLTLFYSLFTPYFTA